MNSCNSSYYERIASDKHNGAIDAENQRIYEWKTCLRNCASVSYELRTAIKYQAKAKNHSKVIGVYFDDMEMVEHQDPEYRDKLANGDVTKPGTLSESVYKFHRGYPLEAKHHDEKHCTYDPASKIDVITALVKIIAASELDDPASVKSGKHANLREYATMMVDIFEDDLDLPPK